MTCKLLNSVADGVPLCKLLYTQLTAFLTIFIIILIEIRVGWENKYLFWIAGMHISGHIHFRLWTPYRMLTLHYHKSKSLHEVTAQLSQCSVARHIHISILSLYNTTRHALIYYKPPSNVEQEVVVFIALMYECSVKLNVSTTQPIIAIKCLCLHLNQLSQQRLTSVTMPRMVRNKTSIINPISKQPNYPLQHIP